jgi:nucleoside diphosphate kinase
MVRVIENERFSLIYMGLSSVRRLKDMYKSIEKTPYFDEVIQMMTSGETDILMFSKANAIEG